MVQNLTWSGLYPRSNFSNAILQRVLTLVPLKATGTEVYFAIMTTLISDTYDDFVETITHVGSLKLKSFPGDNVTDFYTKILVYTKRLESDGSFKPDHLGYTTHIFEDTSDSRLCVWGIQKYKEVTEYINKFCMCDIDVIPPEELIIYESLVQYYTHEYCYIVDLKR